MKKFFLIMAVVVLAACSKSLKESQQPTTLSANNKNAISLLSEDSPLIIKLTGNNDLATARAALAEAGSTETGYLPELGLLFATPGDAVVLINKGLSVASDLETYVSPAATADNPPSSGDNDTYFRYLWGMDAIDAPQAWNMGYKGAGVTVAVLDGGFYITHPDLAANLLVAKGRNFVNWGAATCAARQECDPADFRFKVTGFSHGTHVAGTIAAVDNNIGVIGVAPSAKILPVKVLSDYTNSGYVSWIAQGIVYAVNNGAQVINMSLGGLRRKGAGKGSNLVQEGLKIYNQAIQYAKERDVTVIVAAGNDGLNMDKKVTFSDGSTSGSLTVYPAASPHAVCISASAPHGWLPGRNTINLDEQASYTNFGKSLVDVAAPGGDYIVDATYPYDMVLSTSGPSGYFFAAGTSMAAPHASGVAALIIGKYGGNINPAQVKSILLGTADKVGEPGKDAVFGHGRVNAARAVQ